MTDPVFILGAGFNVDAAAEAEIDRAGYPLVVDLLHRCFGLDALPSGKSVEALFDDSIQRGNLEPLRTLCEVLMEADYYVASALQSRSNAYAAFLRRFPDATFITFNYDSLLEILLFADGRWRPEDGYGAPLITELLADSVTARRLPERSQNLVLHPHGSLCVYTSEFQIEPPRRDREPARLKLRERPLFLFDPESIVGCFPPYGSPPPPTSLSRIEDRVIAPVPNKATGLQEVFVRRTYAEATKHLVRASDIVVIGYSFNEYDRCSHRPLVEAIRHAGVLLVSPDAGRSVGRMRAEYPQIAWGAAEMTFAAWAKRGFPLGTASGGRVVECQD